MQYYRARYSGAESATQLMPPSTYENATGYYVAVWGLKMYYNSAATESIAVTILLGSDALWDGTMTPGQTVDMAMNVEGAESANVTVTCDAPTSGYTLMVQTYGMVIDKVTKTPVLASGRKALGPLTYPGVAGPV